MSQQPPTGRPFPLLSNGIALLSDYDNGNMFNFVYVSQGRNEGVARGHNSPGAESLRRWGGGKKFQQYHKYFFQYSKFTPERAQVRTWERQTCILPRASSNLVMLFGMGIAENAKV